MSVEKVASSPIPQTIPQKIAANKKNALKNVQVQTPSTPKKSCGQWLLEKIQYIWKKFCDFICCRICRKPKIIEKPVEVIPSQTSNVLPNTDDTTNKTRDQSSIIGNKPRKPVPRKPQANISRNRTHTSQVDPSKKKPSYGSQTSAPRNEGVTKPQSYSNNHSSQNRPAQINTHNNASSHTHSSAGHTHGQAGHTHVHNHANSNVSSHTHSSAGHTHSHAGHTHEHNHANSNASSHTHSSAGHTHSHAVHTHEHNHANSNASSHTHSSAGHTHSHAGHTHEHNHANSNASSHTHSSAGHTHSHAGHTHEHNHIPSNASHTHSSAGHTHSHAGHTHGHDHSHASHSHVHSNPNVSANVSIPSTPINNTKIGFPVNEPRVITLPFQDKQVVSHVRISMKGNESMPQARQGYLDQILHGDAHALLVDANFEKLRQPTLWGTGVLDALGECSCETLSRTKNPNRRREFDDTVLAHVCTQIARSNVNSYTVTHFATGYLFASFVQAVQLLDKLKTKGWKGKIIWNVIDTSYTGSIHSNLTDGSKASKAILCFKDQIASILPPGVTFDLNVFESHSAYIRGALNDQSLKYDFIAGMDLGEAYDVWNSQALTSVAKAEAYEFMLSKVLDPDISPALTAKGIGKPNFQLRKAREKGINYTPLESSAKNKTESKRS